LHELNFLNLGNITVSLRVVSRTKIQGSCEVLQGKTGNRKNDAFTQGNMKAGHAQVPAWGKKRSKWGVQGQFPTLSHVLQSCSKGRAAFA